jgi:hypothetical protein
MKPPIYKKDVLRLLENYTGDLGKWIKNQE